MHPKTFKIQISGCVQGVGFRPFIFNLAKENKLAGSVSNNALGVIIYINSSDDVAKQFLKQILTSKPDVATIQNYSIKEVSIREYNGFDIFISNTNEQVNTPLTPDFAVCNRCKREIHDIDNRRFNYAFTTCVHCGPRYGITTKFPFERVNTSLLEFEMCSTCKKEYTNPKNNRFHSQTNSCKNCGIELQLVNSEGEIIEKNQQTIIKRVAQLISKGEIIAIKNTNGYLLCCDASNKQSIQQLRQRKNRLNKPFAVLYPNIKAVRNDFAISNMEESALQSKVAPIVILQNLKTSTIEFSTIAPNLDQTGVMLPSSSLLELIVHKFKKPLIATSGNMHGSSIISANKEAQEKLQQVANYFLHHNLHIQFPQDDSVVKFVGKQQVILRRSRGLAPNYLEIDTNIAESTLAMGAHLKSAFSFVPNKYIYVSQYFGNLDNYDVLERYKKSIHQFTTLFKSHPKTILIDKHPLYQSSLYGKELSQETKAKFIEIQHHEAHFASVLGEHTLFNTRGKILGVVWDGTGLGKDDHIWGGEFFIYQDKKITRKNHFEYFDWMASDKMAKEPRLSLFSLLNEENRGLIEDKFTKTEWKIYTKTIKTNTLKTSSVGRLFDAVASALDIVDVNSFEAEAAMLLENYAIKYLEEKPIDLLKDISYKEIPSKIIINKVITLYKKGMSKEKLAYSFIFTLAQSIILMAIKNKIKIVACSGGVFQNSVLILVFTKLAKKESINIKLNRKLSSNDENISFGQLMYQQYIKE